jgi:[ribosomal protein S5]-alanine N-acetyltransferase
VPGEAEAKSTMTPAAQPGQLSGRPYFLESLRTGLRTWTVADLPLARALWGDGAVTRFIDSRGALDEAQVHERLLTEIATREAHGVQYWPVFLLAGGDFLGCCGLRPYKPEERLHEFGIHLCSAHWGRGLATEVAQAVLDHAFRRLGLPALFAGHHPNNEASRRLLTKLGFRHVRDEHYAPTGLQHPSYLLTRESFDARTGEPTSS